MTRDGVLKLPMPTVLFIMLVKIGTRSFRILNLRALIITINCLGYTDEPNSDTYEGFSKSLDYYQLLFIMKRHYNMGRHYG
jgi:hypothetical protein